MGRSQFEYWQHTHLIIDVVPGRGSGFSVEAPEGFRFLTRSRVYTDAENDALDTMGPPPTGVEHVPRLDATSQRDSAAQRLAACLAGLGLRLLRRLSNFLGGRNGSGMCRSGFRSG